MFSFHSWEVFWGVVGEIENMGASSKLTKERKSLYTCMLTSPTFAKDVYTFSSMEYSIIMY